MNFILLWIGTVSAASPMHLGVYANKLQCEAARETVAQARSVIYAESASQQASILLWARKAMVCVEGTR